MDDLEMEQPEPLPPVETLKYEHPGYAFSGGNVGGQSMDVCLSCFGLVQWEHEAMHTNWHVGLGH